MRLDYLSDVGRIHMKKTRQCNVSGVWGRDRAKTVKAALSTSPETCLSIQGFFTELQARFGDAWSFVIAVSLPNDKIAASCL